MAEESPFKSQITKLVATDEPGHDAQPRAQIEAMIPRRVSTVLSWLEHIGMLRERGRRFVLRDRLPRGVGILDYDAPDEPLAPEKHDLKEYNGVERKFREAGGYINVLIDDAARERANESHQMLTDLVASKIRGAGSIPKRNKYIDLSALMQDELYIFEMKSTTDTNVHTQIRRAVSQLYEYRYLQQVPTAKLVVVIENPPPTDKKWIVDYVLHDRKLLIVWDGDRKSLKFPTAIGADLRFLA